MPRRVRTAPAAGFLWTEEGEPRHGLVAEVAVDLPVQHTYSFAVPEALESVLKLGHRVRVPLGRRGRLCTGFVTQLDRRPWDSTLRTIGSLVDDESFLGEGLIALGREISAHYCSPLGQTLRAITPEAVRKQRGLSRVRYVEMSISPQYLSSVPEGRLENSPAFSTPGTDALASQVPEARLKGGSAVPPGLEGPGGPQPGVENAGLLSIVPPARGAPYSPGGTGAEAQAQDAVGARRPKLSARRRAILDALAAAQEPLRSDLLLKQTGASSAVLAGMVKAGLVRVNTRRELDEELPGDWPGVEPTFELNAEQQGALAAIDAAIDAKRFAVALLFGVSGSGKTEVYVRAMRRVLQRGQQAILLVPEIVLTTQLVGRLASRFRNVAVMHSGLSDAQRSVMWQRIAKGERSVVIGTRSAVFAPCPNLGLICVDEEQEASYKNLQAPRFHVRDVAIMRGKQLGIPIVLGSATPSLETWQRSGTRADYQRIVLSRRVRDLPLPVVHVINMEDEIDEVRQPVVLSRTMERLLGETLFRGEQALILMNRRGYAHRIYCPGCRMRLTCPNCNVGLVVHFAAGVSVCHYCRAKIATPTHCPNVTCGEKLIQTGLGTQRVEAILAERFRTARIQRVDSDTMRHRSHYQRIVDDFEARKIDVLVGTQMIAKGLDFPFVSFVGVVNADPVAMATDFRAHERLFQLITQVAGRAGRADAPGKVVVQTMTPGLPALTHALRHDYVAFAEAELQDRARVGWPPFSRLARIVLTHAREETARKEGETLAARIVSAIERQRLENADVLGPNPCALSRLRGKYRYDVLVRTEGAADLRRLMQDLDTAGQLRTKAESTIIDVDPVSLL